MNLPRVVGAAAAVCLAGGCGAEPWDADDAAPRSPLERARAAQAQAADHFGLPLELTDAAGIRYRVVPPGDVLLGSPVEERGRGADETRFEAHLPVPFFLSAAEIPWRVVRRWRPQLAAAVAPTHDDAPAHGLTHGEATELAAWLNTRDPSLFHRLPSEAEWEHACRAGERGPWGAGVQAPEEPGQGPVGERVVNAWGLEAMHGGVAEWCRTWYAPYPSSPGDLPTGPLDGVERVVRGGSAGDRVAARRSAARAHLPPGARDARVGVRLLVEVGYGVPGLGRHELRVMTYGGEHGRPGRPPRPGQRVRLVSVPERLTARQEDRAIRWVDLEGVTPLTLRMLPGRYYFQAYAEVDGVVLRGIERKCTIPDDLPEVEVDAVPER